MTHRSAGDRLNRPWKAIFRATLAALSVAIAGCAELLGLPASLTEEYARAERAVESWVDRHPAEWELGLESGSALARPEWSQACAAGPPSGFTVLRYEASGAEIDLFFRCPVASGASVQQLQSAFSHVVLQRLPHGIDAPGWEFRVLTPSSAVQEGVTFQAQGGRLHVGVETPLYAVYGHSVRDACIPPADGRSERDCYLSREHRIPLRLTLRVPASLSGLD